MIVAEQYHRLNFKSKRLIDKCRKDKVLHVGDLQQGDIDRCKELEKQGHLKPEYGSWCGELVRYVL